MDKNIVGLIIKHKELITAFLTLVPSVLLVMQKISMYFRASAYSIYYGIPRELFTKDNKVKFYENLVLILLLTLYFVAPFILSIWIFKGDEIAHFIIFINFMYTLIILMACKKTFKYNLKWIYLADFALTALVGWIFHLIKDCDIFLIILAGYTIVIAIIFLISSYKLLDSNNPTPKDIRKFEIIDKTEIDNLKIKVSKDMVLMVVDNIGKEMIVLECRETEKKLYLGSKYWVIERKNVGISVKMFSEGSEQCPDIITS